jgi:hypothetical protein
MLYSHAITVLPTHPIYSNRSMCRLKQKKYAEALSDAEECIKLDKTFAKGYYRKVRSFPPQAFGGGLIPSHSPHIRHAICIPGEVLQLRAATGAEQIAALLM